MTAALKKNEHEALERILAEVEIEMLKGDAERVQCLLAQVEKLLEPRWPLESGTWRVSS
jgi:hypothetical protein